MLCFFYTSFYFCFTTLLSAASAYTCLSLSYLVLYSCFTLLACLLSDLFLFDGSGPCFNSCLHHSIFHLFVCFLTPLLPSGLGCIPTHWWLISVRVGGLGRHFALICMRWKRWPAVSGPCTAQSSLPFSLRFQSFSLLRFPGWVGKLRGSVGILVSFPKMPTSHISLFTLLPLLLV